MPTRFPERELNIMRYKEILQSKIDTQKNKGDTMRITTLLNDLKSAFDNVPHDLLFERKMVDFGVDQELINTIQWLYT